jgi:hypothetical protein
MAGAPFARWLAQSLAPVLRADADPVVRGHATHSSEALCHLALSMYVD